MTPERDAARRRSPGWMRKLSDRSLHGLAGRQKITLFDGGADPLRAEWLLGCAISELEWRARRDRRDGIRPCSCEWCCSPFPELD